MAHAVALDGPMTPNRPKLSLKANPEHPRPTPLLEPKFTSVCAVTDGQSSLAREQARNFLCTLLQLQHLLLLQQLYQKRHLPELLPTGALPRLLLNRNLPRQQRTPTARSEPRLASRVVYKLYWPLNNAHSHHWTYSTFYSEDRKLCAPLPESVPPNSEIGFSAG